MNRRAWLGVAVIGVALVAVLAGNTRTKTVGGAPQAAPVSGPPAVGTCVLEPVPAPWGDQGDGAPGYAPGSFGPCTGPRVGEVAGTVDGVLHRRVDQFRPADDPQGPYAVCIGSVAKYLGLPDTFDGAGVNGWTPALSLYWDVAAPSLRQQGLGQDWVACVVRPTWDPADQYSGSLQDAGRSYLPILATCRATSKTGDSDPVECSTEHDIEEMGTTTTPNPDPQQQHRHAQCLDLAKTVTGMADPSAGGRLRVSLQGSYIDIADGAGTVPGQMLTCRLVAVGGGRLIGPLMGLHDRPVPIR